MIPLKVSDAMVAIAGVAGLVLGAAAVKLWSDAEMSRLKADYATTDAEREKAASLRILDVIKTERAERDRITAEAAAARQVAEDRAATLATRLAHTQRTLAAAIKEDAPCAEWASQPVACPVSWAALSPPAP